ncbi:MAG TPA: AAA family ATPase [Lacipirellulaceae bacterium]
MKIVDIRIDGFGVWHDLALRGLSPEVTVFYGPNEAGKSTLMNFLRTVLYGVTPSRRKRYLPPLAGGRPGGWLKVVGDDGPLTISRYADRSADDVGKVTVTAADGKEQGDRLLRDALEHIDEQTYVNIFAVGLREVQELGSLSDSAAAQWLYRLTSGLDRVSLYDVIQMLARTRLRLLSPADEPSEIRALISRREQLQGELGELVVKGRRWAQSAVKLRELGDEIDDRQRVSKELAARARRLEVAINLKPLWGKRDKLDDHLQRFEGLVPLEEGALTTLDEVNKKFEEHQRQRDILKGQRHQLRDEAERLGINEILVASGARLEALAEQQDWLTSLEREIGELTTEVSHLQTRLESENERFSQEWTGAGKVPPAVTSELVDQLAPQAKAIETTEHLLEAAKNELEHYRSGEHHIRSQIESAMTSGDKLGLPMDVDGATELVAKLRRRKQVDDQLAEARDQASELQAEGQELIGEQVIPLPLFSWLMALFVLGFMLLALWYLEPRSALGQYGWWLAAAGAGGSIFAWLFKYFVEESAVERLDACHRQLSVVAKKVHEVQAEQRELDGELPVGEGSSAMRLAHAERHLAELERLLPVESRRREAASEMTAAERRVQLATEKNTAATANWKSKLRAMGLPDSVHPEDLAMMAGQYEQLEQLRQRQQNRRDDLARRRREYEAVTKRITALADEAALKLEKATPLVQLDRLLSEYRHQKQRVAHRDGIRERARAHKIEEGRHAQAALGHDRRRLTLFQKHGVEDERGLRQLADRHGERDDLHKKRAGATREISAAIGKHGTEQDFAPHMAPEKIGALEHDWETLTGQVELVDRELKELLQQRGALVEQQRATAADQSLARKQMELDETEQQLEQKIDAWRERAAVSLLLERIRHEYEQHRQPETLREASKYMSQLTSGKYTRIWTPLANDILLLDTPEGKSLPVDVLSRGTREQLFVSLRLALVSAYARRGIHLPMILDDVFVNFDAGRTKVAVSVLRDFAKQGHQLLVFTCHEHVWRMFADVKVDTRRIPNRFNKNEELDEPTIEPEPVAALSEPEPEPMPAPKPKAVKRPKSEPEPVVEVVDEELEPVDELEEIAESAPAEIVIEYDPKPAPAAPLPMPPTEVEYWWDSRHPHGEQRRNGHNGTPAPIRSTRPWPASPMIHRPDWW